MLLEPPIDALVKKVGNPYKLAVIVSKRAKKLQQTLTRKGRSSRSFSCSK